jgi:predicted carbohydrate-binding protein with CBM5 and CBM33 domain
VEWQDDDASPAYYTVRVEQIDGNIAWSSPVWVRRQPPEQDVPGRVVQL